MCRHIGCVVLLLVTGCTIQVQPWGKTSGPAAADPHPTGMIPANFQGPMPRPLPVPAQGANNETVMQLIKQYNEADDHRKALLEQVNALKRQVKEREDNLRLASHEMEE